jgi:hypothetical protein
MRESPVRRRLVGVACAGAALVAACSGSTSTLSGGGGSVSVSGTVDGMPLAVTEVVALLGSQPQGHVSNADVVVIVTNFANTCAILGHGGNPPSAQVLELAASATGSTVPTGQYVIGATPTTTAAAGFTAQDATCTPTSDEQATKGTITLTQVTDTTIAGSFDVTFANGDHLTGTFAAPVCVGLVLPGNTDPVCGS